MDGGHIFEAGLAPYKLKPIAAEVYEHSEGTFPCNFFKATGGNKLRVQRPSFPCRVSIYFGWGSKILPLVSSSQKGRCGEAVQDHHPQSQDAVPHFLSFAAVKVSDPMSRNHGPPETWHKNCAGPRDLLSVALNSVGKTWSWEAEISSVIFCTVIKMKKKKNVWRGSSITSGWEGRPVEITEARNEGNAQEKRRSIKRALQQPLLTRVDPWLHPYSLIVPSFISPIFFLGAKQMLFHIQSSQSLLTPSLEFSLFVHNIQDQSNTAESFPMW